MPGRRQSCAGNGKHARDDLPSLPRVGPAARCDSVVEHLPGASDERCTYGWVHKDTSFILENLAPNGLADGLQS